MKFDAFVIGANGMFGHCASEYLNKSYNVLRSSRMGQDGSVKLSVESSDLEIFSLFKQIKTGGIIINAVGLLADQIAKDRNKESAILVNSLFPHRLSRLASDAGLRMIHISTDAVFSANAEVVNEDVLPSSFDIYGCSKLLGEVEGEHCLTFRCSIIGPPLTLDGHGLWAWVMRQPKFGTIKGFTNQVWKGATTRQLAKLCNLLVETKNFNMVRDKAAIHHFAPNEPISKYNLLLLIAKVTRPDLTIEPALADALVTRQLISKYSIVEDFFQEKLAWSQLIQAHC